MGTSKHASRITLIVPIQQHIEILKLQFVFKEDLCLINTKQPSVFDLTLFRPGLFYCLKVQGVLNNFRNH